MKKIILSAAVAAMAFSTSAMAADKGIDITTNGQAVVYYQTVETDNTANSDLFNQNDSTANVGLQLDLGADLGNNFTFGSQITYIGSLGLENNLVGNTMNMGLRSADIANDTANQVMLTKIFVAKKIGNTTLKIGRQELPKSLSPLAFTEGWNVFKNTFDAVVAINTDLPNTTVVAAYVGNTSGHNLSQMTTIGSTAGTTNTAAGAAGGAYMLTAQTTAIPMSTVTGTYYRVSHMADAYWIDAQVGKDLPMGLKVGLQYGSIMPDAAGVKDTDAYGIKVSAKPIDALTVCAAYTDVNDGAVAMANLGTNIAGAGAAYKTPLFTQMIGNQTFIDSDNDTMMLKLAYSLGDMGTVILQGTDTDDKSVTNDDVTDIELAYTLNNGGVNYFAGYVNRDHDLAAVNDDQIVRIWARYNF
jgi:hypothetical protein